MSDARRSFLEHIKALRSAIDEPALLSKAPSERDHNNTARLLRNGISVMSFSVLEEFIRQRSGELVVRVAESQIPFDDLPRLLREASVRGAARAMMYHGDIRRRQGDDYLNFMQEHSRNIGSTGTAAYTLSSLSLGWSGANLSESEVKDVLRALNIKDAWGEIDKLSARVGVAAPSLRDGFRNAALRRHRGAHDAAADTEISHLSSFIPQAIAIALSFDALASASLRKLLDRNSQFLSDDGHLSQDQITLRFINPEKRRWREIAEGRKKAARSSPTLENALERCLASASARHDIIVVRDKSLQPVNWIIPYVA